MISRAAGEGAAFTRELDDVHDFVSELVDRRGEQLGVGAEVVVERAARHSCGRDHILDHRGVDPLFSEHEQGALDELAAHARAPLGGDPRSMIVGNGGVQHSRLLGARHSMSEKFLKLILASE